jgi:hypothetical protein
VLWLCVFVGSQAQVVDQSLSTSRSTRPINHLEQISYDLQEIARKLEQVRCRP